MTRSPSSPGALLEADHRRLDAILSETKRLLKEGDLARAASRFEAFRAGLERHIEAEEEVLFPAFEVLSGQEPSDEAAGRPPTGPVAVMKAEHVMIRRGMAEVAGLLEAGDREGVTAPLGVLTAHLLAHNGKEERILYPATDELASEAGRGEALAGDVGKYLPDAEPAERLHA